MTIKEIIALENDRKEKLKLNVVHLLKEGNFYHANDWSAWLMTQFPVGEAKNKPMNVTTKKLKDEYIHAFVGFPVTSMAKYVPNDGSVSFEPVSDMQIDMVLNEVDFGDATFDDLRMQVDEWKMSLPITDSKKHRREGGEVEEIAPKMVRMSDVLNRILSYPLSHKSPIEAWEFLHKLQQDAALMF